MAETIRKRWVSLERLRGETRREKWAEDTQRTNCCAKRGSYTCSCCTCLAWTGCRSEEAALRSESPPSADRLLRFKGFSPDSDEMWSWNQNLISLFKMGTTGEHVWQTLKAVRRFSTTTERKRRIERKVTDGELQKPNRPSHWNQFKSSNQFISCQRTNIIVYHKNCQLWWPGLVRM